MQREADQARKKVERLESPSAPASCGAPSTACRSGC
jgi:hypothetical protein